MTDGYREGLSVGKPQVMQKGFDAGYPLGVEVGLRVGNVLGVLEGVVAALGSSKGKPGSVAKVSKGFATNFGVAERDGVELGVEVGGGQEVGDDREKEQDLKYVQTMYTRAQEELKISELLKVLDDEKVAAIPDAFAPNGDDHDHDKRKEPRREILLRPEIEDVIRKWESLVRGALRQEQTK